MANTATAFSVISEANPSRADIGGNLSIAGNSAVVKVLRGGEIYSANLDFSAGTGTFGDLFIAISDLYVLVDIPGCTDSSACNYSGDANLDDGTVLDWLLKTIKKN